MKGKNTNKLLKKVLILLMVFTMVMPQSSINILAEANDGENQTTEVSQDPAPVEEKTETTEESKTENTETVVVEQEASKPAEETKVEEKVEQDNTVEQSAPSNETTSENASQPVEETKPQQQTENNTATEVNENTQSTKETLKVEVSVKDTTLTLGSTTTAKATVSSNVTDKASQDVTWAISPTSVAKIDAEGNITAVGTGEATVVALSTIDDNTAGQTTIKVVLPTLSVEQSSVSVERGKNVTVKPQFNGSSAFTLVAGSNNENVATVVAKNNELTVYGVGKGEATITVAVANASSLDIVKDIKSVTFTVTVTGTTVTDLGSLLSGLAGLGGTSTQAETQATEKDQATIDVGSTTKFTSSSAFYHSWSSENPAIATVSATNKNSSSKGTSTATITGVSEGTTVIVHKYKTAKNASTTVTEYYTITVQDKLVYVAVYATDGLGSEGMNKDMMEILGISFKQNDGYFPVGVITLKSSFFAGKTSPFIKTQADFDEVLAAISVISTAELQNSGAKNKDNTVAKNLDKVQVDLNQNAGSKCTALFTWSSSENGSNIALHDGKYYAYHLDLRFTTHKVTYSTIEADTGNKVEVGTRPYLTNTVTIDPRDSKEWYLDIPEGYQIEGYYSDEALTKPFKFGGKVTEDMTIYVKLTYKPLKVTYDLAGGTSTSTKLEFTNLKLGTATPTINTPTREGYEFVGWVDDQGNTDLSNYVINSVTYTAKWKIKEYSYQVNYYLNGTTTKVADSVTGTAKFKSDVTAELKNIAGYTAVAGQSNQTINIKTSGNTVNYYYYKNVTLTADSETKEYNGSVQSVSGYSSSEKAASFEGISATVSGTNAGEYTNSIAATVKGMVDTTGKYIVTDLVNGKLTITAKAVTITVDNASKKYGESDPKFTGSVTGLVNANDLGAVTYSRKNAASDVNVGKYNDVIVANYTDNKNYKITVNAGDFEITKRNVTLTSASGSKMYDGSALTNNKVTVSGDGFAANEGATYTVTGTITDYGTKENSFTYTLNSATLASNYNISTVNGTLSVSKRSVTLTSATDSKTYDGTPLTNDKVTITGDNFVSGEGATCTVTGTITDKGSVANSFTYQLNDGTNADNYNITTVAGTLTVNEVTEVVTVTIKEASGSYTYDGEEKVASGYSVVSISNNKYTKNDYKFNGTAEVKATNAGTYNMQLKPEDFTNINANFTSVEFVIEDGSLVINPITTEVVVKIKENGDSTLYDGTEKIVTGYSVVSISNNKYTKNDYKFNGTAEVKATNAGTYQMNVSATDFENISTNFTNVKFEVEDNTLVINKRQVSLTSGTSARAYNGTVLSNHEVTVGGKDGFAPNEGIVSYTNFASILKVGSTKNTFNYNLKDNTKADNYEITVHVGTLSITAVTKEISISAASDEKMYNGQALINQNYEANEEDLVSGDTLVVTVSGSIVDAGTVDNVIESYKIMRGNEDVTSCYSNITTANGTLKVTKRNISLASESKSKPYDGTALTAPKVTVTGDGFVGNEGFAALSANGSVLNANNSVVNTITYTLNSNTKAINYNISTEPGTLSVTQNETNVFVYIKENGTRVTYDGTEKQVSGYTVTRISNSAYSNNDFTFNGTAEVKATNAGTYPMQLSATDFTNINDNFTSVSFIIEDGSLIIDPITANLEIKADSDSKLYDGSPLTKPTYTYTAGVLANGDSLTAVVTGSITDAGSVKNNVTSYNVMRGNEDVTANYENITTSAGDLTVNKRNVTLTSETASKTYDGSPLTNNNVSVTGDGFVAKEGATYNVTGTITNQGSTKNTFTYSLNEGTKAANYNITKVEGDLTVNKITTPIIITTTSANRMYNGSPLTAGYSYTQNVLAANDKLEVVLNASITDAGSVKNTISSYKVMRGNEDVTANYTFADPVIGDLTVNKRNVTLTSATASKTYDGTALTNTKVTVTGDGFVEKEGATYNVTGTITNQGSTKNTFTYSLNEATKAANYNITKVEGLLTVAPIDKVVVTITEKSNTITYDGKQHELSGYDVSISDSKYTVNDFDFKGNDTVTATTAGTYPMQLKAEDFTNKNGNFASVEFVIVDGALTINPITATLTITADSESKMYDGKALTAGYSYTENVLADGDKLEVVLTGSITNAGTAVNKISSYKILRGTSDVTANYENIKTVDGNLLVSKRDVTLTSTTASKTYDGTPLTNKNVNVTGDGFAENEGASYNVTGTITNKGSVKNSFTYNLTGNTNSANYNITKVEGDLTVEAVKELINITAGSASKKYDGTPLTADSYQFSEGILVEGDELVVEIAGEITNVGTAVNKVNSYKVMRGNEDVTDCYSFGTISNGTLEVTKRQVTFTSASATKVYDGSPLVAKEVSISGDGLAAGETVKFNVTGSQERAGSSENSFTVTLDEGTLAENYEFETVVGRLTVTKINSPITISAASAAKTYDGSALVANKFDYTQNVLVEGDTLLASVEGSITNAGSSENKVTAYKVVNKYGEDVTANYSFNPSVDGKLTVNKVKLEMASLSDSKVYDGTALTNGKIALSGKFVEGEGAKYTVTGSITNAGTAENSFTYQLNENTLAENYEITTVFGSLEVTAKSATVTAIGGTKTYGEADPEFEAIVTGLVGDDSINYEISREEGKDVGKYAVVAAGAKLQGNYVVSYVNGTLEIVAKEVSMESASASKTYDGTALTDPNVTAIGFVEGEGASYTVTGSITNVGTTENTFTYELNENTKAINYVITKTYGSLTVNPVSEHTLLIHYINGERTRLAKDYSASVKEGDKYNVASPVINGYSTDKTSVEGVMADKDVELWVVYSIVNNSYVLTVNYVYENGDTAAPTVRLTLGATSNYRVLTPIIAGYSADRSVVSGTMPRNNVTVNVVYSLNSHNLTIKYEYPDGTPAVETVVIEVPYGQEYEIETPEIEGYVPSQKEVKGTMGDDDVTVVVTYAGEEIIDPIVPTNGKSAWALVNLIIAVVSALISVVVVLTALKKKDDDDDDKENEEENKAEVNKDESEEDDKDEKEVKKHYILRLLSVVAGIIGVIFFFYTEDMSRKMVMIDKYTLTQLVIGIVNLLLAIFAKTKKKDDDKDDEEKLAEANA